MRRISAFAVAVALAGLVIGDHEVRERTSEQHDLLPQSERWEAIFNVIDHMARAMVRDRIANGPEGARHLE